jgi:hypothetical protein
MGMFRTKFGKMGDSKTSRKSTKSYECGVVWTCPWSQYVKNDEVDEYGCNNSFLSSSRDTQTLWEIVNCKCDSPIGVWNIFTDQGDTFWNTNTYEIKKGNCSMIEKVYVPNVVLKKSIPKDIIRMNDLNLDTYYLNNT